MNDAEATRLLQGVDGPRPLPPSLDIALTAALTDTTAVLASVDEPRPLPEDLRRRLEATLVVGAARPLPRPVARRLTRVLAPSSLRPLVAAAAALALVVGVVAVVRDRPGDAADVAVPVTTTSTVIAGDVGVPGVGSSASGAAGAPFLQPAAAAPAAPAAGVAAGGSGAAQDASAAIEVAVTGDLMSDVGDGFQAYLDVLNGAGGIGGRRVVANPHASAPVAMVNVGSVPFEPTSGQVVLESAFVEESRLVGSVVSLSSPVERQARLAVDHAFPEPAPGRTAAVYTGEIEPFASVVPDAFAAALQARGVTVVRVPFEGGATAFVPADAAFLALSTFEAAQWIELAPRAPEGGVWGIGSAWSDGQAARAEELGVTVLSPYRPIGGDEQAVLVAALGEPLSVDAVHGWVTGKALALLLSSAPAPSEPLTEADLDRLVGWNPGWAPTFEVRPATRARTPDAVPLHATDGAFVAAGEFERDA